MNHGTKFEVYLILAFDQTLTVATTLDQSKSIGNTLG